MPSYIKQYSVQGIMYNERVSVSSNPVKRLYLHWRYKMWIFLIVLVIWCQLKMVTITIYNTYWLFTKHCEEAVTLFGGTAECRRAVLGFDRIPPIRYSPVLPNVAQTRFGCCPIPRSAATITGRRGRCFAGHRRGRFLMKPMRFHPRRSSSYSTSTPSGFYFYGLNSRTLDK